MILIGDFMTPFQQDLLKILLDKFLLGVVAAGFGFYLARLLENYRSKKAYELFVWQQRIDACRSASRIVTEHYCSTIEAFAAIKSVVEKGALSMEDENAAKMLAHLASQRRFYHELVASAPLLLPRVSQAASDYLNEAEHVSDLLKGKFERGMPTEEELIEAYSKFKAECSAAIEAGPYK